MPPDLPMASPERINIPARTSRIETLLQAVHLVQAEKRNTLLQQSVVRIADALQRDFIRAVMTGEYVPFSNTYDHLLPVKEVEVSIYDQENDLHGEQVDRDALIGRIIRGEISSV